MATPNKTTLPVGAAYAYEVVDATNEEAYYTLGLFATQGEAMSLLDGEYPPYSDDNPDSVTVEVRRRPLGFHPHAFAVIASKTWVRYYGEEPDRDWEVHRPNGQFSEPPQPQHQPLALRKPAS